MMSTIKPPDLMIYIKASIPTLVNHIQSRGREYEGNMSLDYLKKLNFRYDQWIEKYDQSPLLIVDADKLDFINRPEDMGTIFEMVGSQTGGLFLP